MADTKLSFLTELAATPDVDDELYIRDISEVAASESKRITIANLFGDIKGEVGSSFSAFVVASDAPAKTITRATTLQADGFAVWVCDGTADDVQIQAAITYVATIGGTVLLSEGTFNTSSAILLPQDRGKGLTIRGSDWIRTLINYSGADYAIKGENVAVTSHHSIENMRVLSENGGGIRLYRTADSGTSLLRDVYVGCITDEGITMAGDGINIEENTQAILDHVVVYKANRGIVQDTCYMCVMMGVEVYDCTGDGIVITDAYGLTFQGVSESNGGYGIKFGNSATSTPGGYSIEIHGSYFEVNQGAEIRFDYDTQGVTINGTYVYPSAGDSGIDIAAGSGFTIASPTVWTTAAGGMIGIKIAAGAHKVVIINPVNKSDGTTLSDAASDTITIINGAITLGAALNANAKAINSIGGLMLNSGSTIDTQHSDNATYNFRAVNTAENTKVVAAVVALNSEINSYLRIDNALFTEKAAAIADIAGYGQFWVKDDAPNIPKFTDDAGTDFSLLVGNGINFGPGGVTSITVVNGLVTAIS